MRACKKFADSHCVKIVKIRSFSGPYFPIFRLSTKRYKDPNAGKYGPEKTPYLDLFHTVSFSKMSRPWADIFSESLYLFMEAWYCIKALLY